MLNITAQGNIGNDPELKTIGDKQLATFSLAVNTNKDETTWITCNVWGPRSSIVMQYLTKGGKVTIVGRGKNRAYLKKDGTAGCSLEVEVYDFTLPLRAAAAASEEPVF